jgi:IclR family acetate operon transcriptional repressor
MTTVTTTQDDAQAPARNAALSLRRGLRILDLVADRTRNGEPSVSLTTLSGELGTSKSTVLRLTAPMLENDLLRRTADAGFTLGLGSLLLGQSYLEGIDLRAAAAPFLRRTAEQTALTCHLVVPDGTDIVYVDKVETRGTVRMASRIGNRLPMRNTASGKAMVAFGEPSTRSPTTTAGARRSRARGTAATASTTARTSRTSAVSRRRCSTTRTRWSAP